MPEEKLPPEYDAGVIQKVIERVSGIAAKANQSVKQALYDTSQKLADEISRVENKVDKKRTANQDGQGATTIVPVPQELTVFEFGLWGFAHIDPFLRLKYPMTVRGYEFYGSMNVDENNEFEPKIQSYTQAGYNYGTDANWLDTEDTEGENSFILDRGLIGKQLENVETGASGPITAYGLLRPRWTVRATGVTWSEGDRWRIVDYPKNRLFSIGSLCIFYKRTGTVYVKARSLGRGHSYSGFTSAVASTGLTSTEEIAPPEFKYPVHSCGRTCKLEAVDDYYPRCSVHGIVSWDEIIAGTRQTAHASLFGFEWCNIEVVWEEVSADEDARTKTFYHVRRWVDEPLATPETATDDEEEADVR